MISCDPSAMLLNRASPEKVLQVASSVLRMSRASSASASSSKKAASLSCCCLFINKI